MKKCWIMLSCAVVLAGSATAATTWYVATDGDDINNDGLSAATPFATIQKAIDSATAKYDTVEIADGTYFITEAIRTKAFSVELRSASLDPTKVIVDAQNNCVCLSNTLYVTYENDVCKSNYAAMVVNGITFQNGFANAENYSAGGIVIYNTTATVTNCIVRNCYHEVHDGEARGGGISYYASGTSNTGWSGKRSFPCGVYDTLVENCAARTVDATTGRIVRGGGIYMANSSASGVTIRGCAITNSSLRAAGTTTYAKGGGAYFYRCRNISNCTIAGCEAIDTNAGADGFVSAGGGLYCEGKNESTVCALEDLLVCGNRSGGTGGGIALAGHTDVSRCTVTNNTIIWPGTKYAYSGGGGIHATGSNVAIRDSLIAGNDTEAHEASGGFSSGAICLYSASSIRVANCAILDNRSSCAGVSYIYNSSDIIFTNCVLAGNVATNNCSAFYVAANLTSAPAAGVSVVDCMIVSNRVEATGSPNYNAIFYYYQTGSGTKNYYYLPCLLRNCFIAGNVDNTSGTAGWGVRLYQPDDYTISTPEWLEGSVITVDHCTFASNICVGTGSNGKYFVYILAGIASKVRFGGCVFYGNRYYNGTRATQIYAKDTDAGPVIRNTFCDNAAGAFAVTPENGNLSTGTLDFENEAALDFRPRSSSCLIDKGGAFEDWMGDGSPSSPSRDMGTGRYSIEPLGIHGVRIVRPSQNPRRYGAASDMGCFEYWFKLLGTNIIIR